MCMDMQILAECVLEDVVEMLVTGCQDRTDLLIVLVVQRGSEAARL